MTPDEFINAYEELTDFMIGDESARSGETRKALQNPESYASVILRNLTDVHDRLWVHIT